MPESERSQEILDEFYGLLDRAEGRYGFQVSLLAPDDRVAEHLFLLNGAIELVLYVKVRSEPPPSWGLTANRLCYLEGRREAWAVLLLFEMASYGFVFDSREVRSNTKTGVWRLASDGDYKVHDHDVRKRAPFQSIDELIDTLRTILSTERI